jgi:PBP1b-binding outer membrane lipoprotein LpoB
MKKIAALAVLGLTVFLAGCGSKAQEPFKDAPGSSVVNQTPADKILMPDGFSNITTKCDHGNRIYVAFHGDSAYAAIAVVPQDPTCK